jgi:hypothetical protein
MTTKEYFDTIDINEIDRFLTDKQEENIELEFKTVNHPDYNDENRHYDKENISEVLSGFANSNGGIVVWGIKCKANSSGQDVAKEKKPIKQLTKFLNLLNRLESQAVTPPITGIEHKKIVISDDTGFIKTFIPKSDTAPHMANFSGKHYFKRSGDSFIQCEHYDIVDMFSRKKSPQLRFVVKVDRKEIMHQSQCRWRIIVSMANDGNNIAKYPYLALNISPFTQKDEFGLNGNRGTGLAYVKNNVLYQHNYSGGIDQVIYPGAVLDIDKFYCELPINADPPTLTIDYTITAEDSDTKKGQVIVKDTDFQASS